MSRSDRLAILISLIAFAAAAFVSLRIYEGLPHIEDEVAYTWQAKLIARGQLTVPSPQVCPKCFLVPFVIDYNGQRFGKYPLGWPVVLAMGEALHGRAWVNPILSGFSVWLAYLLGKKLNGSSTGIIMALLITTSPFFLMISGSLLSHTWSLMLTLAFTMAWLDAFTSANPRLPARFARHLPIIIAALCMAVLALTRPLTAVGVALPFAVHGVWLLLHGDSTTRNRLLFFGVLTGSISLLHIVWQFAVTGQPFLNPYTLWWPYDTIGFGPGVGLQANGYTLLDAWNNLIFSLSFGMSDLFGWPGLSWIFLPFGIIAILTQHHLRRCAGIWIVTAILPMMVLAYTFYWIGSWLYGPRYYYEGLISATLLTALGMQWLAGRLPMRAVHISPSLSLKFEPLKVMPLIRFVTIASLAAVLMISNLLFYVPARLGGMVGLYGVSRNCYQPFETTFAQDAIPALVFVLVKEHWVEYGCMVDMSSPFLDSDFVLVVSFDDATNAAIAALLPGRSVLYYDPLARRFELPAENIPQ